MNDLTCSPCLHGDHRRCVLAFKCACSVCRNTAKTNRPAKFEALPVVAKPETPTQETLAQNRARSFLRGLNPRELRVAHIMLENGASDYELMEAFKISLALVQSIRADWQRKC